MCDFMSSTPVSEMSTELRTPIRSDSRGPAKKIEPNLKMTGYSLGCQRLELLVDGVARPFVHTDQELATTVLKKIETD